MMVRPLKSFICILGVICVCSSKLLFADSLTLSTYYPAPYGAYDRIRLVPRDALSGECQIGSIYSNDSNNDRLEICANDGSNNGNWIPIVEWTSSGNDIFLTNENPAAKVGIGTSSPGSHLHIQKDSEDTTLQVEQVSGSNFFVRSEADKTVVETSGNTDIEMKTNGTSRLFLDADGGVGVGTTEPSASFEVNGNMIIEGNGSDSHLRFQKDGEWYSVGIDASDSNNFKITRGATIDGAGATAKIVLRPNGDIEIHGKIFLKIDDDPLSELKIEYIEAGANSGYYAMYAP